MKDSHNKGEYFFTKMQILVITDIQFMKNIIFNIIFRRYKICLLLFLKKVRKISLILYAHKLGIYGVVIFRFNWNVNLQFLTFNF